MFQIPNGVSIVIMASLRDLFDVFFSTPPDDITPCVSQANSFREVVSLQAMFVTLTVALLAYVTSAPTFQLEVDLLFMLLASLPLQGLVNVVRGRVKTDAGDAYVCTKPVRPTVDHHGRDDRGGDLVVLLARTTAGTVRRFAGLGVSRLRRRSSRAAAPRAG